MPISRRLAALMFTDMVGYSALAREDEEHARELVEDQRAIIREALKRHHGREHQTTGDGFFLEFASAVNAVECAIEIQTAIFERGRYLPADRQIQVRIGVHIGDILTNDEDLYGNGVNIAARIEPLAKPGGICVSRQVHDQVVDKIDGATFQRHGRAILKNIRGGAELFHVVLPHEKKSTSPSIVQRLRFAERFSRLSPIAKLNASLLTALAVGAGIALAIATAGGLSSLIAETNTVSRMPAADESANPVDLAEDWSYSLAKDGPWQPFEIKNSWKYADIIKGTFWLRKSFSTEENFKHPAIVLGLIRDRHRVLLNGQFIGGADQSGDLAYYAFDNRLIRHDVPNEILIEAETRETLNPGLALIPDVGARLSEFSDVRDRVRSNVVRFHVLRNVYFGLSLTVFLGCLFFLAFRRTPFGFYYCTTILLLSSIHLAYYSPWINDTFDFPFVRFLKIISLALVPMILSAAYAQLHDLKKVELAANISVLATFIAAIYFLIVDTVKPSAFTGRYNLFLFFSAIYAAVSFSLMAFHFTKRLFSRLRGRPSPMTYVSFEMVYIASVAVSISSIVVSFKAGVNSGFVPTSARKAMLDFSLAFPLTFSVFVITIAIYDYARQSRSAKQRIRRDSLVLEIVNMISKASDPVITVGAIQQSTCSFLKAGRSTLYVLKEANEKAPTASLVAEYTVASGATQIRTQLPVDSGVIGYVVKSKTPLLITDIGSDKRFNSPDSQFRRQGFNSYQTVSCMILPLLAGEKLLGALTFADRGDSRAFSQSDFETALQVAAHISLLLENRRLHDLWTEAARDSKSAS